MTVYVLSITHRRGCSTEVHATRAGAVTAGAKWARDRWETVQERRPVILPAEIPDDDEQAITQYFSATDDEWCEVDACEVIE